MTIHTPEIESSAKVQQRGEASLRLACLPAGACYACAQQMVRSSGGKWLCKACGFLLTCCDP